MGVWVLLSPTGPVVRVQSELAVNKRTKDINREKLRKMNITGDKTNGKVEYGKPLSGALADRLGAQVSGLVGRGAGVTVFRTRNGSAVGFRLMWGAINEVEYHERWEELIDAMADALEQMSRLEGPPEPVKPGKERIKQRIQASE